MHFLSTILSVALACGALAVPIENSLTEAPALETRQDAAVAQSAQTDSSSSTSSAFIPTPIIGCLFPWQANNIVNAFNYLLANPKAPNFAATANALFSNDWTDTSDSINQLASIPEGSVTFANKAQFITQSGQQPPLFLQTLDTFNSCNKVGWRWISISGTGNNMEKVKGIDVFNINQQGQIQATYAEFNSGAWLADLGYPECAGKK